MTNSSKQDKDVSLLCWMLANFTLLFWLVFVMSAIALASAVNGEPSALFWNVVAVFSVFSCATVGLSIHYAVRNDPEYYSVEEERCL